MLLRVQGNISLSLCDIRPDKYLTGIYELWKINILTYFKTATGVSADFYFSRIA